MWHVSQVLRFCLFVKQVLVPPGGLDLFRALLARFFALLLLRYNGWDEAAPDIFGPIALLTVNDETFLVVHKTFSEERLQKMCVVLGVSVLLEKNDRADLVALAKYAVQALVTRTDRVLAA